MRLALYTDPSIVAAAIPNRPVFRAQEVCEIADVQPYVLRGWESEFPDLGVAKTAGSPRVYRRADVERVLRLKQLVFVDGLTLAGARKQLIEEGGTAPIDEVVNDSDVAAMLNDQTRHSLQDIRRGLQWILGVLSGEGMRASEFALQPPVAMPRMAQKSGASAKPKPGKKAVKGKKR